MLRKELATYSWFESESLEIPLSQYNTEWYLTLVKSQAVKSFTNLNTAEWGKQIRKESDNSQNSREGKHTSWSMYNFDTIWVNI